MKQTRSRPALAAIGFLLLLAVLAGVWRFSRPAAQDGEKIITVEVVHKDGSEKSFDFQTDHEYLGAFLVEINLISGTESQFGIFVDTVDGETADYAVDHGWWQLLCDGEAAQTGADSIVLEDGSVYTWVYTIG